VFVDHNSTLVIFEFDSDQPQTLFAIVLHCFQRLMLAQEEALCPQCLRRAQTTLNPLAHSMFVAVVVEEKKDGTLVPESSPSIPPSVSLDLLTEPPIALRRSPPRWTAEVGRRARIGVERNCGCV